MKNKQMFLKDADLEGNNLTLYENCTNYASIYGIALYDFR